MKIQTTLVALLVAEQAVAGWLTKSFYDKWHQTELERWLSDHGIPYPTPSDRKELESKVKSTFPSAVESPWVDWDLNRLQKHAENQGLKAQSETHRSKDSLVKLVKDYWQETSDSANKAYGDVREWIFDSWSDSQLKAFCDKHGVPVPQPRQRDSLIKAARENYQSIATKLSETSAYPGNWLYDTWSDSELKAWLDERGIPAPQTGKRDDMIAAIRRNSRVASLNAQAAHVSITSSAKAAQETLTDQLLDSWSDSQIKEWADKNGIKVPQGSTRNELIAIARKHSASLASSASSASSDAASAYGAASSSAGNEYAKATEDATLKANDIGGKVYQKVMYYVDEVQYAAGLKKDPVRDASRSASSASKSLSSAYTEASKSAKGEL